MIYSVRGELVYLDSRIAVVDNTNIDAEESETAYLGYNKVRIVKIDEDEE